MRYEIKTLENVAVFSLTGKMLGDKLTTNLYDEAKSLIGKGIKNIIIDLRQIDFINSIGLGVIIANIECHNIDMLANQLSLLRLWQMVFNVFVISLPISPEF